MKQYKTFYDNRWDGNCSYCGIFSPDTKDHVPSKILLYSPFPENLPVVACCDTCNQGFSKDEAYVATLLECVLNGTTEIEGLKNEKIKRVLAKSPGLHKRLTDSMKIQEGIPYFEYEPIRIQNVLVKLAKGHIKFELGEFFTQPPADVTMAIWPSMTSEQRNSFIEIQPPRIFPEIGSRSFVKHFDSFVNGRWEIVQPDIYQYFVDYENGTSVRILIRNYLAAVVTWKI